MLRLRYILILMFSISFAYGQGTKIEITTCKEIGIEGTATLYEVNFKVLTGNIEGSGRKLPLALPLPNNTKAFAYLEAYDDVATGKSTPSPASIKVYGHKIQIGKQLVSHDLAPIKKPVNSSFEFKTYTAFLSHEPGVFFGGIHSIKGFAAVGDEIAYTNARGQQGKGKILNFELKDGDETNFIFDGIPDNLVSIKVLTMNPVDFSESTVIPASAAMASSTPAPTPTKEPAHKIKAIPLEVVLENKEVKITVHQLIRFNPDPSTSALDIFHVDYTLDYYIVDATFENKTNTTLDLGDYLLRFNFFSTDGKSADEFLRIFKAGKDTKDETRQDADKIDTNIFGGTSKIPLANVMVKYIMALPDYDARYKAQTDALYKPFAPKQKIRSVNATIMGVPPSYKIEGLGTWNGTFFDKKQLLFVAVKL